MAKKEIQLPKGFTPINKFNGKFAMKEGAWEFSKPVKLNSVSKGVIEGYVYRYPLAPHKLYFGTLDGEFLEDITGFSFGKENLTE